MDIIVKFLFYSGRYLIVVTTQSFIEALKRSSQMKTKITERIDKSFDVIGCHQNMLQLINDNFEGIGSAANIQLAFISDKHKVEFERYLKNLEKSVHGVEINDQLTRVVENGFPFPYQNKMISSIINQYTSEDGFDQEKFATTSTRTNQKNSDCPNERDKEFFNSKTSTQEIFGNEDFVHFSEQKYVYMNELNSLPISKQDVDEEISINNTENDLTEPALSNRSNSSDMSCELQESPIMSQLFDYDNKALASVIGLNNDKNTHYVVKNPITDFCKDLKFNLKSLRNKKARNLLTATNSQTLVKKLMNNKRDESMSCKILNNLMSRSSEFDDLKTRTSLGAGNSTEVARNNERISTLEVDFSKLFHQNSESFRIFERRLHDIRIKRSLDELRNERIREIHNIKGAEEFSETNEKSLTEKAMKQIIKDLSHNLDATMRKLVAYDTRFSTIDRKLKQLEQLSISSSKSNVRDLLSEISVDNEIELLKDDAKKIENQIVVDELHGGFNQVGNYNKSTYSSQLKRSEIPIPKSMKKEGTAKVQNFPHSKSINQDTNKIRTKFTRKLNKNTFIPKKTYFHSIKHCGHSGKSQLTESIQNYKKNILRLPFRNPPISLPNINDEVIDAKKLIQNTQSHNLKGTSKLNLPRKLLPESLTEYDLNGQSTTELNESKGTELKLQENVSENLENIYYDKGDYAEELETESEICKRNGSVLDDEPVDISTSIKQESIEPKVRPSNAATDFDEIYDSVLDAEPLDLPQCVEHDTKDLHLEKYENDPKEESYHINQTKDNCAVPSNTDKFDEIIIEDADGLEAEKSQILSSEELNAIEGSSEIPNYIKQLSHKLDNSMKRDCASNLEVDLLATGNFKPEDVAEIDLKSTTNNEDPPKDHGIVNDASSDYISDMNSALQNCFQKKIINGKDDSNSTRHVPLFSTIDLNKYNTVNSDEPLAYKYAIMSNNISIKQAPRIKSEKIIIDEYSHYDVKKAKEHIRNKEEIKTSKSDEMVYFQEKKTNGNTLNVDKGFEEIEPSGSYEFQKIREHVKNLDKAEALSVLPIDEMLEKELVRCCIGKPNHLLSDMDKAREHLVNKPIKKSSLINESITTPGTDYEKISIFQYEIKKALEHFKTKDTIKLKPLTDIEKKDLEKSPTLSWDNKITTEDGALPNLSHKTSILDIHDAELDEMYPKIDNEEEIGIEGFISEVHKNENKNEQNANVKSETFNNITNDQNGIQANYNCITKENENALEVILLDINNIIGDKNILDTRACKEQVKINYGVEQSSKSSTSKDGNNESSEEKYMKMYNLLKSIKETIQAHKIRVEKTIKNYEDLFQQSNVDVPIQEQGDVDGTAPCHNSINHLDHRQVNLIADAVVQEDIQSCELTKVHDPKSTTPLVNRENFRTMMSAFLKKHKKNEEFIQSFKQCKPIGHNLGCVQYKSFLNEYSRQFFDLHDQISAIAGPIIKTDYEGTAKADGSEEYLQNKALNVKQLEKGMFEDQISKLSIETEKNRSNAANKSAAIASTRISMPMLQRENLEIDKMIEVNKKAFSELESSLKVVKLIGSNTSGNLSMHSVLEEPSISATTKSLDKNIIVLHDHNKFNQCHAETILINGSANDSLVKGNEQLEPRICSNDCVNPHLQEENDDFGLSRKNCCVAENNNLEKYVLIKNYDNITTNRKCSDKEFQRDKHSGHTSLKQHEVKKKEYHTRCTNMSKDPKDEDKQNTDIPTALIVSNNTEIPIQMMPMIDDSIFLNNFNIDKSLISFEEPHKNLVRIHGEIGCNEDYLKESITENTLFKNLINLEEVRKFFRFNERKTLAENEDKHSIEEVKKLDDLEESDQKPIIKDPAIEGTQINARKENDMLKGQYINENKIAAEENIEIIKQQSLRKRHIETKPIDTRTQVEIEESILKYKQNFNKKLQVKVPKWTFSSETQNVNIINQLKDFISATDSPNNDSAPNVNAVQFKNKSETNNCVLVLDPPEKKMKSNALPVQSVQKQPSVERYINKTELGNMDFTQQGDITQNDLIQVEAQINELLQGTENFTKTQNDFKAIGNVTKEINRARAEQEKNNVQEEKNKKYSPQSHLQELKLNRNSNFYERNELRDEEFTDFEDSVTIKSIINKNSRTSTPNLNQIKNNIQQSQEEYIFIEPTRVAKNENIAGMFEIEDISDRKANIFAERTDKYEHMKSKSELHEHYRKHVNPIYRFEHSNPKFVQNNVHPSEIKDDHDKNSIPSTNNKFEQFLDISKVDAHTTSPYIDAAENLMLSKNNKPFKFSKSKHEAFFKDGKFSNAGHLVNKKHDSVRKMRNHLKSMGEINKNSEQTQRKFQNIYNQIRTFDPEQSKKYSKHPESENVSITDELVAATKKAELLNQINILPQKTAWSQDYNGRKKLWKRLQHVKKLANEKNSEKLYVLGTKLPTLKTNTLQTSRISEKLLPIKKPIQYQYQVKKVRVGDRIMNITYLVEVADSKI